MSDNYYFDSKNYSMETKLYIEKKDEVFAKIHCEDRGFLMFMYEHFARYVRGYIFTPAYKAGTWDGKIKFYNRATSEIYLGLVNRVIEFCRENDMKVVIDPSIVSSFNDERIDPKHVHTYLENLSPSNGKNQPLEWRPYQVDAVKTMVQRKRRMIASPTASGKSLIIYSACRYLLDHKLTKKEKILIVVPTINLIRQMKSDFIEYSQLNEWAAYDFVTEYGGGKKNENGSIIVATWQSLFRKPQEWFDKFSAIIVDEAHQAKSKSLVEIGKACTKARYRIGMSGSFEEEDETTTMTLNGLFGNKTTTTTTREMIDNQYASKLKIRCIQLLHQKLENKYDYQAEVDYIVRHEARNEFIADLATGLEGNTLILLQFTQKHGLPFYEKLKKDNPDRKVYMIYGGVAVDERERIRKILETENNSIIVATYMTMSTGANFKNLENIIFASPTKSFSRVIQSIGRGLRLSQGKEYCTLYDVYDFITGDKKKLRTCNHTFLHFLQRLKIYDKEKHEYEMMNHRLEQ